MDIAERFEIDAPVEPVWEVLRDPRTVAECFPGTELTEDLGEDTYRGRIVVRFGPTTASFSGRATIVVDDAERVGRIDARGKDRRGSSGASAHAVVRVEPAPAGAAVTISGTIDVTGPLAGFAGTGGRAVTQLLLEDFASAASARARVAAAPAGTSEGTAAVAAPPTPPSLSVVRLLRRSLAAALRRLRASVRRSRP